MAVRAAVARLWAEAPVSEELASSTRHFSELTAAIEAAYLPNCASDPLLRLIDCRSFLESALRRVFRWSGAPWFAGRAPASSEAACEVIHDAFTRSSSRLTYLCPLDQASDSFPEFPFGPCEIVRLSEDELAELTRPGWLLSYGPSWIFDCKSLANRLWLVVSDEEELPVGHRIAPPFLLPTDQAIGEIDPYASNLPLVVEQALFALYIQPWGDLVGYPESMWKPFRIPWIYRISNHPLARPRRPPEPDSLWSPRWYIDEAGQRVEEDERRPLRAHAEASIRRDVPQAWKPLERVCSLNMTASDAFNPLVRHFAVRAFREEGFDEILFHHFAVEALFEAPQVTKPSIKKIIGNLLDNATAHRWNDLRDFRNDYVHGRRPSTSFYSQNLTELQILAAALITAMLHEVEKHPDLSRHQLLYALSQ